MDVSLSELLASTGAIPEVILGAILVQIVAILEHLHDIGGCVHNDIDARNFFISTDLVTPDVRLGGFFYSHFPLRTPGASIDAKNGPLARHARKALLKLYQGSVKAADAVQPRRAAASRLPLVSVYMALLRLY